ncbi:hypothetical protein [Streptomyces sp. MI02-7b]|uniref:SLOG cluster 4 domain-containing protein n=1 Tax=Streptomyces sp. MI02-7b TaxID=462941 RepID=UPI0039F4CDE2
MTRAVRPRWARHRGGPRARARRRVGEPPALRGVVVVRGGLGGVMGAVCQGTRARGGVTVGLLPGRDRAAGNRFLTVCPPTTGSAYRATGPSSAPPTRSSAAGGSRGTLGEMALAMRTGRPMVVLAGRDVAADPGDGTSLRASSRGGGPGGRRLAR